MSSNRRLFCDTGLCVLKPKAGYHVKSTPMSIGNLPPIQTSWAAYAVSFLIPLTCASRELTASARSLSIASISWMNISGCWSYLVEMYCRIAVDSWTEWVRLKGRNRMLLRVSISMQDG